MPRIVKTAEQRQDEILDVAQRLFMARGYADTPVQAIIDEVGIAKGTFYHHYPSKSDLLDALTRRMVGQSMGVIGAIVEDPNLSAIDKMTRMCRSTISWKYEHRDILLEMMRALRSDANVLLSRRMERDAIAAFIPEVAKIVAQGVAEGVFDTPYPTQAGQVFYELGRLFEPFRESMLDESRPLPTADTVRQTVGAYNDAVERLFGAAKGSMRLMESEDLVKWLEGESLRRCS